MPRRKGSARTEKASAARRGAASADGAANAAAAEGPVLESDEMHTMMIWE